MITFILVIVAAFSLILTGMLSLGIVLGIGSKRQQKSLLTLVLKVAFTATLALYLALVFRV